jgi:hypothetical protein
VGGGCPKAFRRLERNLTTTELTYCSKSEIFTVQRSRANGVKKRRGRTRREKLAGSANVRGEFQCLLSSPCLAVKCKGEVTSLGRLHSNISLEFLKFGPVYEFTEVFLVVPSSSPENWKLQFTQVSVPAKCCHGSCLFSFSTRA